MANFVPYIIYTIIFQGLLIFTVLIVFYIHKFPERPTYNRIYFYVFVLHFFVFVFLFFFCFFWKLEKCKKELAQKFHFELKKKKKKRSYFYKQSQVHSMM